MSAFNRVNVLASRTAGHLSDVENGPASIADAGPFRVR